MKLTQRFLALLLSLLLAFAPLSALSEELAAQDMVVAVQQDEPVENSEPEPELPEEEFQMSALLEPAGSTAEPIAEPSEEPTVELTAEPSEEPTVEPTAEPTAEPTVEPTVEPSEEPTVEPSVEPTAEPAVRADELPEFCRGYARLPVSAMAYESAAPDSLPCYYLEGGVVYASARRSASGCDRILVHFDGGDGALSAWMDARNLVPLGEGETAAFISAAGGALCLDGDAALPLQAVAYSVAMTIPLFSSGEPEPDAPAMLLENSSLDLGLKETRSLGVSFSDGGEHQVSYVSENTKVATVNEKGEVTGKTRGSTNILITSDLGNEITVPVNVKKAPTSIKLSAPYKTLGIGEWVDLTAALSADSASRIQYSSSKTTVAAVDAKGRVTAVGKGTATITAKTYNKKSATLKVTVKAAPEGVDFGMDSLVLGLQEERALPVSLTKDSAGQYSYACEQTDILQLDPAGGRVTALALGEADVTVKTYNDKTDTLHITVMPAPSCVNFAAGSLVIGKGESLPLPEVILGEEKEVCGGGYTYKSEKTKYVTVSADGAVKGKAVGSSNVWVTTFNGHKAKCKVTVRSAPSKVTLNRKTLTLGVDDTFQLKATLPKNTAGTITITSDNEAAATVDASGLVTAVAPGEATITARTFNGKTAKCKVTVCPAPLELRFEEETQQLGLNEKRTLAPVITEGSATTFTYSCEPEGVISLDAATGEMKALAEGETLVTVVSHNELSAQQAIIVKKAPDKVEFGGTSMTLGKGEIRSLPEITISRKDKADCAGGYSLSSSNKKVAAVYADGTVKGVGTGSATITVKTYNGKKDTYKVTVKKAPGKVTLSEEALTLGLTETFQLKASLPSGTAGVISIISDNPGVATVDSTGLVTAVGLGSAVITASTYTGTPAVCTVNVLQAPQKVYILPEDLTLGKGETAVLTTKANDGAAGACTFESKAPSIVTVDAVTGKVTAKATGTAEIVATAYNGVPGSAFVTVVAAPSKVHQAESKLTISVGDSYQLSVPTISNEDAACSTFKYSSSATKYAKVSAGGLISGVRTGSATITVKTYNGKKDTVKVTVKAKPSSIAFGEQSATRLIDDIYTPVVNFSNKAVGTYTLYSSDESVAAVTPDGKGLLCLSGGSTTITAVSFNDKVAEMVLNVLYLPESIELKPEAHTLGAGDTLQLEGLMPEGQGCHLIYTSSNEAVATVDRASGLVSTHAAGTATITVTTRNGLTDTCGLTVLEAPSRVQLTPRRAQRSLEEGGLQLCLSYGSETQGGRVSYSSSDEAVATVDANGYVTFHAEGSVRIRVQSYNNRVGYSDLQIGALPGSMIFPQENYTIALGDSVNIPVEFDAGCESYTYAVSDEGIAAVSGDRVTGLQPGSCTLTAVSNSGLTASCTITVAAVPTGVELQSTAVELILHVSEDIPLQARCLPDGIGSLRYISTDPDVAAVDYVTGEMNPVALGSCEIIVSSYDGAHSARCSVTVANLLEGVKIGIDPGHQGKGNYSKEKKSPNGGGYKYKVSTGTRGRATGIPEHVQNLKISKLLRDKLEFYGAEVYMTRETADVNISNQQRAKMMNKLGVDLVLRLHCNGSSDSSKHGASVFVRRTGTKKKESEAAAKQVLKHLVKQTGAKNRGLTKTDDYTGLNWSTVPSMLLEMGYMTNRAEDKRLNDPKYQEKLVRGMVNGICAYMGRELPFE